MFYILERAKCVEAIDKFTEHVIDYYKKGYEKANKFEKRINQNL